MVHAEGGRIDVRAEGPGLVVVAAAWDRGWEATVDGVPAPIVRVNHAEMAVPIEGGIHRVVFRHHARGLLAGVAVAALAALGLGLAAARGRVDPSPKRVLA
jgi:uncharacterized membrane protein YfhO